MVASGAFSWFIGMASRYSLLYGSLASMIILLLWLYLCGTIWYFAYAPGGLWAILAQSVLPYLLPDTAKMLLALWVSRRLKKASP